MNSQSNNERRAPIWWRVMQCLTVLAIGAYLVSASGCTPRPGASVSALRAAEPPAVAESPEQAAQPVDVSAPTRDSSVLRFDHSVIRADIEPDPVEMTGNSVAAYAP